MFAPGLLRPYVKNIQTVYLITKGHESVLEAVSSWFSDAQIGSIRSLTIWQEGVGPFEISGSGSEEYAKYLTGIRVLRLNAVHFGWDSPAYHNLLHLQLGCVSLEPLVCPTVQQILAILLASPKLHILQLAHMSIRPGNEAQLQPIVLEQLRVLELRDLSSGSLCLLLPNLVSRSESLSIRIDLHPSSSDDGSAVLAFLARNNVTRAAIPTWGEAEGIVEYLSAIPDLTTLILEFGGGIGDAVLAAFVRPSVPLCPALRTLYLDDGELQSEDIEAVVKTYPLIKKLRLAYASFDTPREELLARLKPLVQDVAMDSEGLDVHSGFYWFYHMI